MNILQNIHHEHSLIEKKLEDLEVAIESRLNYPPALVHTFRELHLFWEMHEKKEDFVFSTLKKSGFDIPTKKITFQHGQLKKQKQRILNAFASGSEQKIIKSLTREGKKLIDDVRSHMEKEEWILLSVPWKQVAHLFQDSVTVSLASKQATKNGNERRWCT